MTTTLLTKPRLRVHAAHRTEMFGHENRERILAFVMFLLIVAVMAVAIWLATFTKTTLDLPFPFWFMP